MITLEQCENTKHDAKIAFQWRNDARTIESSEVRRPKSWDSFWLEFSECYFDALCPVFVKDGGSFAGFIRFDAAGEGTLEIVINIAPEFRGMGIGTEALALVKNYARDNGFSRLAADIRATNKASLAAFRKAGYAVEGTRTQIIQRTKEKCSIVRVFCLL
ncbi:MAG TPA: hypothetical protein DD624_01055 [Alphaproteobacteria bacterium]|nr:hypothetical protein [Alphaproteobacteria bacterium]